MPHRRPRGGEVSEREMVIEKQILAQYKTFLNSESSSKTGHWWWRPRSAHIIGARNEVEGF